MRIRKLNVCSMVLLFAAFFAGGAAGALPDSGWYWNSAESGRGFNIEIQDNVLFIAGFVYDAAGNPTWCASGGPMDTDHTYTGPAFQTVNGQPLGAPYRTPTIVPFGTAVVTFTTTTTADITVNGYQFSVERQQFGFDFTSITQPLLGELAFVTGNPSFPVYFGERITFTGAQPVNGSMWAVGNRTGEFNADNLAVGQYSAGVGLWTVLLDSSPSYYTFFTFHFDGFNLVEGQSYLYLKGSLPTASLDTIGNRIRSAQAAAGGDAPGVIGQMVRTAALAGTDDYEAARAATQEPAPLPASYVGQLHALEAVLQQRKAMLRN